MSHFILKSINSVNDLKMIIRGSGLDIKFEDLVKHYKEATKEMEDWFLIDTTRFDEFRYRKNYTPLSADSRSPRS
jgi:hypothetical protein